MELRSSKREVCKGAKSDEHLETDDILAEPDVLSALEEGLAEIKRGETVALADLRRELAERRPSN